MESNLGNLFELIKDFFSKSPSTYKQDNSIVITINPQKHSEIRLRIKKGGE